jgi:hypothetical protein
MNQIKAMSRSSQLLLGAGLLLFIFLFLDWQKAGGVGVGGWNDRGAAAGSVLVVLLVWEALQVLGMKVSELGVKPATISAGLAALVLVCTIIKFLVEDTARHWPAWIGLILAIAIGLGGFLRWQGDAAKELQVARTPPPAPPA